MAPITGRWGARRAVPGRRPTPFDLRVSRMLLPLRSTARHRPDPAPRRCWPALAFLLLGALAALGVQAQPLRLGGTGSALGTAKALGAGYAAATRAGAAPVLVPNLGSAGALKALEAGAIDVAFVARPLTAAEAAAGLVATDYGRSPFVLVTSKPGVASISTAEVAAALSGEVVTWPDGQRIRLVLRPKTDTDMLLLAGMSPRIAAALDGALRRPGIVVAATDQEAADEAERLPGSLSVTTLSLLVSERRRLEVVALDGIAPTPRSIADGTYPYVKSLRMVTRGAPQGAVRAFVGFVASAEGRAILVANGHRVAP